MSKPVVRDPRLDLEARFEQANNALGGMSSFPVGTQKLFGQFYDDLEKIGLTHGQVKNVGFALKHPGHRVREIDIEVISGCAMMPDMCALCWEEFQKEHSL